MNKKQKLIFALSVVLTVVSAIAYASDRIIPMILASAAASCGYFKACGGSDGNFFLGNQEESADDTDSQNVTSDGQSATR